MSQKGRSIKRTKMKGLKQGKETINEGTQGHQR